MSDTRKNQAEYPQHGSQTAGCGFPITKLVVIFSLLTGSLVAFNLMSGLDVSATSG